MPSTPKEQKEAFREGLNAADGKVSLEQAKDIYHYLGRIREIKAESDNRILKGTELENVLKSIGIDPELAAEKTKDCDAAEIDADNTVSTKTFEIGLPDAHVSVSADRTDLVTLEVINGEKYILVYNGELYNTPELRTALQNKGHSFTGHSDTEVLLHAFAQWGRTA